jgi:putative flavoprotein involved in K+ transport
MTTDAGTASCLVIGAGPAGLATAAALERRGVGALVVERGDGVATSWRGRYDGFRLNTSSWFSYLPGRRFPRQAGRWPSRDALVAYYEDYAKGHGLRVVTNAEVERIVRAPTGWRLDTKAGALEAPQVVVATGKYRTPTIPDWPGQADFAGEVVHSADYRNARPYHGRDVLVVGPGNSGFEIAVQLAEGGARSVRLSIRTPPHVIHREIGPFPSDLFAVLGRRLPPPLVDRVAEGLRKWRIGDLSRYGLESPPDGLYERLIRTGMIPTADGRFVTALEQGEMTVVPALERFEGPAAILADGSRIEPSAVIAATGYARDLEPLVGHLGVVGTDGRPLVNGARDLPQARGLRFIGFSEPLSGNLRQIRLDARRVASRIGRDLEQA